jgi:His/Glu/Gln/Arg/opine family amino acid ABC transporter permease subunit
MSISLTVGAAIIGFIAATLLAITKNARIPVLGQLAAAYVEFIRNTPLIVQLFVVAFGLPLLLGYQWPFWAHALLGLTLNFSAYFAEILRSGLQATPKGQIEAVAAYFGKNNPGKPLETKFIVKESPCFIGVKKGSYDLLQWVNVFILHKKLGGQLNGLSEQWFGQKLPPLPAL